MGPRFGKSRVFWLTQLSLILAPMFKIGYNMDFSMRASIPALCVLCVFVIRFLTEEHSGARRKVSAALLAVLLMIGAVTPLEESCGGSTKFAKRAQFSLLPIRSARCFTPTRTRTTSSAATCASTGSIVTLRDKGDTLGRCPKPYPET